MTSASETTENSLLSKHSESVHLTLKLSSDKLVQGLPNDVYTTVTAKRKLLRYTILEYHVHHGND